MVVLNKKHDKLLLTKERIVFMRKFILITSNALDHWRQPVESEFQADFQSDWQAQLGGNFRYLRR